MAALGMHANIFSNHIFTGVISTWSSRLDPSEQLEWMRVRQPSGSASSSRSIRRSVTPLGHLQWRECRDQLTPAITYSVPTNASR